MLNISKRHLGRYKKKTKYNPEKGLEEYDVEENDLCDVCGERPARSKFTSIPVRGFRKISSNYQIGISCRKNITEEAKKRIKSEK